MHLFISLCTCVASTLTSFLQSPEDTHCARKWRAQRGRPAQGVSEARAAVRGRQETD